MKIKSILCLLALLFGFVAYHASAQSRAQEQQSSGKQLRSPDVVFVPTPYEAVDAMLKVAKVGKSDIVYDLGSGDGRIPIMAVQKYNAARAIGIDINPDRIKEAEAKKKKKSGGLFSIFVSDLCKGCAACVTRSGSGRGHPGRLRAPAVAAGRFVRHG